MSTKEIDCESINDGRAAIHKLLKMEKRTASYYRKLELAEQKAALDDVYDSLYQRCVKQKPKLPDGCIHPYKF